MIEAHGGVSAATLSSESTPQKKPDPPKLAEDDVE